MWPQTCDLRLWAHLYHLHIALLKRVILNLPVHCSRTSGFLCFNGARKESLVLRSQLVTCLCSGTRPVPYSGKCCRGVAKRRWIQLDRFGHRPGIFYSRVCVSAIRRVRRVEENLTVTLQPTQEGCTPPTPLPVVMMVLSHIALITSEGDRV